MGAITTHQKGAGPAGTRRAFGARLARRAFGASLAARAPVAALAARWALALRDPAARAEAALVALPVPVAVESGDNDDDHDHGGEEVLLLLAHHGGRGWVRAYTRAKRRPGRRASNLFAERRGEEVVHRQVLQLSLIHI